MELDLEGFKKIELFGWAVAIFITFFCFGNFFVFIAIAIAVRRLFMWFKKSKLGLLPTEGKWVVVTGCDSGFGLALANRLHGIGFNVFAMCLTMKSEGATSLNDLDSSRMKVIQLDVTSDDMVAKSLEIVKMECGTTGLWGLVNNAGQDFLGDAELTTTDQYLQVSNLTLYGMVRMCKAFLPLVRQAKGRIVNVTSARGLVALPCAAAYTMAKFGAEAFSDVLRQEMRGFGVKVIVLEPCNFAGVTGCLNDAGLARMSGQLDVMWNKASSDARQLYGQVHLQKLLEDAKKSRDSSHKSVEPVINAFEDALRNVCPHIRYLIPGSNAYFDIYGVLARLAPFLPQTIFEKLRTYFFPYLVCR